MSDNVTEAIGPTADEVLAFLRGTGPLDGVWFGDRPDGERGNFWWRKHLSALEASKTICDACSGAGNDGQGNICGKCDGAGGFSDEASRRPVDEEMASTPAKAAISAMIAPPPASRR
jgi:hypothetical protein